MIGLKSKILAIVCFALGFAFFYSANAQEEVEATKPQESYILPDLSFKYDRDFCDFEISLPEEPKIKTIDPIIEGEGLTSEKITYVKVFDLDKSLRVSATCKSINKEIRIVLSETTLDQDLKAIEEEKRIKIISKENKLIPEQRLRLASLIGQREATPDQGIFVYQVWVSDNSIFTLEAEVKGEPYPETDKLFVAVLKSFKKKDVVEAK